MNKALKQPEKPINWGDQAAHFGACFALTIITLGYGTPAVVLWAITREYYQRKRTMEKVMGFEPDFEAVMDTTGELGFDYFKRDLLASYAGIVNGLIIIIPINIWVF